MKWFVKFGDSQVEIKGLNSEAVEVYWCSSLLEIVSWMQTASLVTGMNLSNQYKCGMWLCDTFFNHCA